MHSAAIFAVPERQFSASMCCTLYNVPELDSAKKKKGLLLMSNLGGQIGGLIGSSCVKNEPMDGLTGQVSIELKIQQKQQLRTEET